jgi:hypothetical protein
MMPRLVYVGAVLGWDATVSLNPQPEHLEAVPGRGYERNLTRESVPTFLIASLRMINRHRRAQDAGGRRMINSTGR